MDTTGFFFFFLVVAAGGRKYFLYSLVITFEILWRLFSMQYYEVHLCIYVNACRYKKIVVHMRASCSFIHAGNSEKYTILRGHN